MQSTNLKIKQPDRAPDIARVNDDRRGMIDFSTSEKLDWLTAVMADHRINVQAKVAAFSIMQHVNRETGRAFVSDATIADKTGMSRKTVVRGRNDLRAAGWITWKRTSTANVYAMFDEPVNAVTERQQNLKDARDERRRDASGRPVVPQRVQPDVSARQPEEACCPKIGTTVVPQRVQPVVPPVGHIPLSLNPVEEPRKESEESCDHSDRTEEQPPTSWNSSHPTSQNGIGNTQGA
jgi:Tfp pilus assembly major pilin PilA